MQIGVWHPRTLKRQAVIQKAANALIHTMRFSASRRQVGKNDRLGNSHLPLAARAQFSHLEASVGLCCGDPVYGQRLFHKVG